MGTEHFDFAVIGSGFGGSIMSMVLRRIGKSVLLIERGTHPRFAIGESSTPFANLLLERLATQYDLPFLKSLSEWGLWQENHSDLAVGLKRGFTFYHHTPGQPLDFADRSRQLLVAASPNDRLADTHWYRPDFDAFLVRQAVALGVEYLDRASIMDLAETRGEWTFSLSRPTEQRSFRAGYVIDASGFAGVLARHLGLEHKKMFRMPPTQTIYAHFRNVARLDEIAPELRNSVLPYPPDDAAVHHVFPGGWCWVLRFNNGITSAGVAYTAEARLPSGKAPEEIWRAVLERLPTLAKTFRATTPLTQFYHHPQLSFRRAEIAGPNWALLPSTAGFVDPLLSTGFPLTLLGITRLAEIFQGTRNYTYATETALDLYHTSNLVSALYAKTAQPEEFSRLTLLYFAAMSFTETAWRLDRQNLASQFLLRNHNDFKSAYAKLTRQARNETKITREEIERAIAPYDIAGLSDGTRQNWYPVDFQDLFSNASKLNATTSDLQTLISKLGIDSVRR